MGEKPAWQAWDTQQGHCGRGVWKCRALGPWGPGVLHWGSRFSPAGNRKPLKLQQHEMIHKVFQIHQAALGGHPLPPVVTPAMPSCPFGRIVKLTPVQWSTGAGRQATAQQQTTREMEPRGSPLMGPGGGTAHPVGPCRDGKAGGAEKGRTWEHAFIRAPGCSALELPGWGWTGQFKPEEWGFGESHGGRTRGAVSPAGLLGATPGAHASYPCGRSPGRVLTGGSRVSPRSPRPLGQAKWIRGCS